MATAHSKKAAEHGAALEALRHLAAAKQLGRPLAIEVEVMQARAEAERALAAKSAEPVPPPMEEVWLCSSCLLRCHCDKSASFKVVALVSWQELQLRQHAVNDFSWCAGAAPDAGAAAAAAGRPGVQVSGPGAAAPGVHPP